MKLVIINLEPEHSNYDNMLKQALVHTVKHEADVIGFCQVKYGSYGAIREYLKGYGFHSHLENDMRLKKEPGFLLFVRNLWRDVYIDLVSRIIVYEYNDKIYGMIDSNKDSSLQINNVLKLTEINNKSKDIILMGRFNKNPKYPAHLTDNVISVALNNKSKNIPIVKNEQVSFTKYGVSVFNI